MQQDASYEGIYPRRFQVQISTFCAQKKKNMIISDRSPSISLGVSSKKCKLLGPSWLTSARDAFWLSTFGPSVDSEGTCMIFFLVIMSSLLKNLLTHARILPHVFPLVNWHHPTIISFVARYYTSLACIAFQLPGKSAHFRLELTPYVHLEPFAGQNNCFHYIPL